MSRTKKSKRAKKPTGRRKAVETDAGARDVSLGEGVFGWTRVERAIDRYGMVTLDSATWDKPGQPLLDSKTAGENVGKVGTLVATVTKPERSTHIGDLASGHSQQRVPVKGEAFVLCKEPGTLAYAVESGVPTVGIRPFDGRRFNWLDPKVLYDLHGSRVKLVFRELIPPGRKKDDEVVAYDAAARAQGADPWQPARVTEVLFEDGAWWVRVTFKNGGRSSILRPEGVRDA